MVIRLNGKTVFDKIWENHVISDEKDGRCLLYVDRHLVHEVTSPVAFEELRERGLKVRRPDLTMAVVDHDIPTLDRELPIAEELSRMQIAALEQNTKEANIRFFDYFSPYQGIAHVVAPELGITLPGITLVCGDSHTCTHGTIGALALGIGTSEVTHVLATQTLWMKKPKNMEVRLKGKIPYGVSAKDIVLAVIRQIGVGGGFGSAIEYRGEVIDSMPVEQRMTLCNMSVEAGARTSIISPDEKTFAYVRGKPFAPKNGMFDEAVKCWQTLRTDSNVKFDSESVIDVSKLESQVTWGTNPSMVVGISERIPSSEEFESKLQRDAIEKAFKYMGLQPSIKVTDIKIDRVFIGSCTNGRLSDLISVARIVKGKKVNRHVRAMIVPGSQLVRRNAERLGLHRIFADAGFEFRNSGCSLCLGMNEDRLSIGERAASTSNRNFENRQGTGGRTHLVSSMMAAAAAIEGHFVDIREIDLKAKLDFGEA